MLELTTQNFFHDHWHIKLGVAPTWSAFWSVTGQGPIPNGETQGCYALYEHLELIYIGLGASRGSGRYVGHGIGNRLYSHVLRIDSTKGVENNKGFYMTRDRWPKVTHLRTIGFPANYGYLAPALELYLLNTLATQLLLQNVQKPGGITKRTANA